MARVRSTARVTHDGKEAEAAETAPISEIMRRSGLIVTKGTSDEEAPATEAEQAVLKRVMLVKERLIIALLCHRSPAIWISGN
jgi:uncharacterized protein YehS (DUF1456 family)